MYKIVLGILVLGTLFLAVRLFLKIREMTTWNSKKVDAPEKGKAAVPRELLELTIETPPDASTAEPEKKVPGPSANQQNPSESGRTQPR